MCKPSFLVYKQYQKGLKTNKTKLRTNKKVIDQNIDYLVRELHPNAKLKTLPNPLPMGQLFGKQRKGSTILIVGLPGAGKVTLISKLCLGEVVCLQKDIHLLAVQNKSLSFYSWNLGNNSTHLVEEYFTCVSGIIFVVDSSSDRRELLEAAGEFHQLLEYPQLNDAIVLIFANKQDKQESLSAAEITELLQLAKLGVNRAWFVQTCSALTREGLYPGIKWLTDSLSPYQSTLEDEELSNHDNVTKNARKK